MAAKARTIDEYLAGLSAQQRAALERLRQAIRAAAPRAEECISYQLPAFRLDGRALVAFGAGAKHCAFYPMSAATIVAHAAELEQYETSKGTIRFAADRPLPAALVRKLVRARMAENAGAVAKSAVFAKLNLKGQAEIVVLNAPAQFETELGRLQGVRVRRALPKRGPVTFAVAFVTRQAEVDRLARALARLALGDATLWFAYPKGTSRRYKCDFNRDRGWAALGAKGFEGVRLVAIDEDWSALRFRRVEFIKSLTRDSSRALTTAGKTRVAGVSARRSR